MFERLRETAADLYHGVKNTVVNTGMGLAGGALDSTLGLVRHAVKGVGKIGDNVANAWDQFSGRVVSSWNEFIDPNYDFPFLHPLRSVVHLGIGAQKTFENFVEAGRTAVNTGFDMFNLAGRGVTRMACAGLLLTDIAYDQRYTETVNYSEDEPVALEGYADGQPCGECARPFLT